MKSYKNIILSIDKKGIAKIILAEPSTYNALSFKTILSLLEIFKKLNLDNKVKVIIIEGQGKGFCAGHDLKEIRGLKVFPNLKKINRSVDMVEVFRRSEDLLGIAEESIEIGAKVLWGQIGVVNYEAARLAENAGLKVVMNRCPKIELFRPFWKPRLDLKL